MGKHYDQIGFERKDGAANMDDIMREVKGIGSDQKQLADSLQKDLADVRKLAEGSKGVSPELEAKFTEITTSIEAKQAALTELGTKTDARFDEFEVAMNKINSMGGTREEVADQTKAAIAFFETKAAGKGSFEWRDRPTAETIDLDGYKAWDAGFESYLRADEKGMTSDVEQKALTVGRNTNGGFFVPTATSARIIKRVYESNNLRALATVETISGESLDIRIDNDDLDCDWAGEEESTKETGTPQIGLQTISVHEMRAKPKISQQMLEDAAVDIEGWLAEKIGSKFGRKEASSFILGNGIKKPRGFLTYPDGSTGARGTIRQFKSGNATAITADGVISLPYQLKTAYMSAGSWMMNRLTVLEVMLLKDNDGQYLWRPGLAEGRPSTLGGFNVGMADEMPRSGAGALSMAFADFRSAYTIVDRLGISTLRDPFSSKPFVEFYTRKRVGGDVTDFEAIALMRNAA